MGSIEHNSDQHHSHHHSHHSHKLHSHSHGRGKEDRFYVLHTDSHRDLKMVVPAERNAHASNSPSASHGLRVIHNEKANTSDPLSAREFARRKLESQEIQNMKAARLINSRGSGSPESARYRSFSVADSTISGISERPRYSHFHNESIQSDISMRTLDPMKAHAGIPDEIPAESGSKMLERRGTRSRNLESRRKPPPGSNSVVSGNSGRNVANAGLESVRHEIGESGNEGNGVEHDVKSGQTRGEEKAEIINDENSKATQGAEGEKTALLDESEEKGRGSGLVVSEMKLSSKGDSLEGLQEKKDSQEVSESNPEEVIGKNDGVHEVKQSDGTSKEHGSGLNDKADSSETQKDNESRNGDLKNKDVLTEPAKDDTQSTTSSSITDFLGSVDGMSSLDRNLTDDFEEAFGKDIADDSVEKSGSYENMGSYGEIGGRRGREKSGDYEKIESYGQPDNNYKPDNDYKPDNNYKPGNNYKPDNNYNPDNFEQSELESQNVKKPELNFESASLDLSDGRESAETRTASLEKTPVPGDNAAQMETPIVSRLATECVYSESDSEEESPVENRDTSLKRLSMSHRMIADLQNELPEEVLGSSVGSRASDLGVGDSPVSKMISSSPISADGKQQKIPEAESEAEEEQAAEITSESRAISPITSDVTDEDQFMDAEEALMKTPLEKGQAIFSRPSMSIVSGRRVKLNDEDSFYSVSSSADNTQQTIMKPESEGTSPVAWKKLQVDVPRNIVGNSQVKLVSVGLGVDSKSSVSVAEHPYTGSRSGTPGTNSSASVISSTRNLILPTPIEERSRTFQAANPGDANDEQLILSPPRSVSAYSSGFGGSYSEGENAGNGIANGKKIGDERSDDERENGGKSSVESSSHENTNVSDNMSVNQRNNADTSNDNGSDSDDELSFVAKSPYHHHPLNVQHADQPRKMVIVNPSEGSTASSGSQDEPADIIPSSGIPLPTEASSRGSFSSDETGVSSKDVAKTSSERTSTCDADAATSSVRTSHPQAASAEHNVEYSGGSGDISSIPKTYDRREQPVVEPLAHSAASSSRKRLPLDIPNEGRGRRSISISTANPGLFDNAHTKERIMYANGSGTTANTQQAAPPAPQRKQQLVFGKKIESDKQPPEGKGQKSLYVERLRGIGLVSYTRQQPSYKVLPVAIRPIRSRHRRTPSHQATIASIQSSLKHGTLRPKTRMLASEIDESELPDSKLSHDLSKTKVPTDPDAEIIEVTNQLRRLTADPAQLSRRESSLDRFSSVRSARGLSMNGRALKLFVANPDENDEN